MGLNIALITSGCGHLDGSEVTEAVSTWIALCERGAGVTVFAPSGLAPAVDHLKGEPLPESRSPRQEAARIFRGQVRDITELQAKQFDALVLVGGYGAAKTLSNWASAGAKCEVLKPLELALREFHATSKPIGAICIAPALVARVLGTSGVTVTIGNDAATAAEILKTGAQHEDCPVTDYVTDRDNKILSTPAFMYETSPDQVFIGIRKMIGELCEMA